jgi:hypothetical protein
MRTTVPIRIDDDLRRALEGVVAESALGSRVGHGPALDRRG